MSMASEMQVTIQLPTHLLHRGRANRLFAVAENGAFGIRPNHIDFVTALVPSVLILTTPEEEEQVFGIDEGMLVKKGHSVDISVRRGVREDSLESLRDTVRDTFFEIDDEERIARSALSRLEADMVRRLSELRGFKT